MNRFFDSLPRSARYWALGIAIGMPATVLAQETDTVRERELVEHPVGNEQMREAQRAMHEAARHYADVSREASRARAYAYQFLTEPKRAMIGVIINSTIVDGENQGVQVSAVTPGGPAEQAGLRTGDTLTAVNGIPLNDPQDLDSPSRLRKVIGDLEEGDEVEFAYSRDGEAGHVTVVAERRAPTALAPLAPVVISGGTTIDFSGVDLGGDGVNQVIELQNALHLAFHGHFWERIELVSLNPQLGRYFGTDEGLLVVSVPEDFEFDIQGGDVLSRINGRVPRDSSHAFRILRSHEAGEVIALDIMRDQGPLAVEIEVPERRDTLGWSWVPEGHELRRFSFPLKDSFVNGFHFQFENESSEGDRDGESVEIKVITEQEGGRL